MRYKMTYILFLFFLLTTIPYIITIYINKENKKNISFENYDSGYKIQDKGQDIDLESYLLKILPGQISMDQEEETIKCQAVILRTDLIRKMGRSKKIKMESIPYQVYKDEQYKSKLGDRAYEIMDQKRQPEEVARKIADQLDGPKDDHAHAEKPSQPNNRCVRRGDEHDPQHTEQDRYNKISNFRRFHRHDRTHCKLPFRANPAQFLFFKREYTRALCFLPWTTKTGCLKDRHPASFV